MSKDWTKDIEDMHRHYGADEAVINHWNDKDWMRKFLRFRLDFLKEELNETEKAYDEKDAEEIVDGLIDLCVIAIGTLDLFHVDAHKAWDEVLRANMNKRVGMKESRKNDLGLPDLIKPEGWQSPSHSMNHGVLKKALE